MAGPVKLIILIAFLAASISATFSVSPPVFPEQYTAHGVILLPYAELREPFAAYYDGQLNRSRIDYYDDLMITLQKSPAAEKDSDNENGAQYKIVYEGDASGQAKRVCFKIAPDHKGEKVEAQNLIPSLEGFTRIGNTKCPIENIEDFKEGSLRSKVKVFNQITYIGAKHQSCELWRRKDVVGEKVSIYSFWFKKDPKTGEPIPVTYEMSGYNNLLGSHYDHYIVHYTNFRDGLLSDELFNINKHYETCGPFPGPGEGRKLLFNPMKAYIDNDRSLHDAHFNEFKSKHSKKYDTEVELEVRRKNFLDNNRFILAMNRRKPTYQLAVNHLADKSEEEIKILRGRKVTLTKSNGGLPFKSNKRYGRQNGGNDDKLPTNWDWRLLGAVNPVKDQAICGSCWSFGTTGTIEGVNFVKTGKLVRLSEQQLIDCSWMEGNNGCDGGEDFRVYNYMMKAGGLSTEEDYGHYLGIDAKCHSNDVNKSIKISGFVNVTQHSEEDLMKALYENGPITVAINAGVRTFSFYSNGIYDDPACLGDPDHLNHQVLLVGYGTLGGKDYWLIKNSWSTYWGNDGYIAISRGKENICGVTTMATYPIIA